VHPEYDTYSNEFDIFLLVLDIYLFETRTGFRLVDVQKAIHAILFKEQPEDRFEV